MFVIFLGAPGTGKGTIAQLLKRDYGYVHISTGNLMREIIASKTLLGIKLDQMLASGKLVPDNLTNEILEEGLKNLDIKNSKIILDGYPRSVHQATFLENYCLKHDIVLKKVILLTLEEEKLVERISGRLICRNCGEVYHKIFSKPKVENICDKCGGELFSRPDDMPEKVVIRLNQYEILTKPLIQHYEAKHLLVRVEAHGLKEHITKEILGILK